MFLDITKCSFLGVKLDLANNTQYQKENSVNKYTNKYFFHPKIIKINLP